MIPFEISGIFLKMIKVPFFNTLLNFWQPFPRHPAHCSPLRQGSILASVYQALPGSWNILFRLDPGQWLTPHLISMLATCSPEFHLSSGQLPGWLYEDNEGILRGVPLYGCWTIAPISVPYSSPSTQFHHLTCSLSLHPCTTSQVSKATIMMVEGVFKVNNASVLTQAFCWNGLYKDILGCQHYHIWN